MHRRQKLLMPAVQLVLLVPRLTAVLPWRPASDLVENNAEVTLIAKADFLSYLGDRSIGCSKQGLCLGNPQMMEIGHEWLPCNPAEESGEM